MMSKAELIASLKKKLDLPSMPETAKERIRAQIAALESSSDDNETSQQIEDLKKKLDLPSMPETAKERIRAKIAALEGKGEKKVEPKKEPKPKAKKPVKKAPVAKEPKVKFVKKKSDTKEEEPTPMEIKAAPKKRGRKPSAKKEEVSKEPKVVKKRGRKPKKKETPAAKTRVKKVFKPTVKTAEGEPDCDTLLKQFRERRAKAKASQKKRKTTPVFRKIASDVVDAVEKAIKNVPAKQIKESPKVVIRKFGNLQKAADSFLKAFRDVLGADYQKSQAEVEINELKRLVENLIKKYSKK
jgi:hypothetical protein